MLYYPHKREIRFKLTTSKLCSNYSKEFYMIFNTRNWSYRKVISSVVPVVSQGYPTWPLPMIHWTSPYRDPHPTAIWTRALTVKWLPSPNPLWHGTSLYRDPTSLNPHGHGTSLYGPPSLGLPGLWPHCKGTPLVPTPWTWDLLYRDPNSPPPSGHWTSLYNDPPGLDLLVVISGGQDCRPIPTCSLEDPHGSDIWWPRLETFSNSFTFKRTLPPNWCTYGR